MVNYDVLRIDLLIRHIDIIKNDIKNFKYEEFSNSDLLVRATCFSLVQIGEQMNKLEENYKELYPNIPWTAARKMRNLIVHVYSKVDAAQIWQTATKDLDELKTMFNEVKSTIM